MGANEIKVSNLQNYSFLDGIDVYREILQNHKIPSSFFVVSEIAESISSTLRDITQEKHEICSHGINHVRPITIPISEFYNELDKLGQNALNYYNNEFERTMLMNRMESIFNKMTD